MIFSVGRVLNLAYGIYLLIGGYAYYSATQVAGLPKAVGFVLAVLAGAAFGLLVCRTLIRKLQGNAIAVEISTLILAVVMQTLVILMFGPVSKTMWPLVQGVLRVGPVAVSHNILAAMVVSWLVLGGLFLFVGRTHLGRAIRAVSTDRKGAIVAGIDPERINFVTWGISGALGAVAGVFFATYTQLHPGMWVAPLIIAVAVVIVGGIGSIFGSLVAAHIIGFSETIMTTLVAAELRGVFTMALIIVVLIVAPKGLFGRAEL